MNNARRPAINIIPQAFPAEYPGTDAKLNPSKLSRFDFPDRTPVGIVVHHTADRDLGRVMTSLYQNGLGYHLIIARDGKTTQVAFLDRQVWHAGKAIWKGYSPNGRFLAVSLLSWGEVKKNNTGRFVSWSGADLDPRDVELRPGNRGQSKYYWDVATEEQVRALQRFCLWAVRNGIPIDNICGHDECAVPAGRKSDPGGVLPMTMAEFRDRLAVESKKTGGLA